jgi:GNAT superfamily N-acetyltransferase
MELVIRKGLKTDLAQTLNLIKELAIYEKAPNEVTVTIQEMEEDGFGKNPIFNFFIAEIENKIVGIALYYIKYSTWKGKCVFLEDIIITESFRQQGIGKKLFDEVAKVAKEMNAPRMEWQVLDWNEPAIKFYQKINSNFDNEWINCKLTKEQIQEYKVK